MEKIWVSWTINDRDGVPGDELDEDLDEITYDELKRKIIEETKKGASSFVVVIIPSKNKEEENGKQSALDP